MADKKISELPAATEPLNDADLVEIVQGGVNKKAPKSAFGSSAAASESASGIAEIATQAETNTGTDDSRIVTPLKLKNQNFLAPLASPGFTGTPTAPTAAAGTSTTQIATTAFVQGELGFAPVSITGATTLDSTAFGKMHICTGTTSAYTIGLPTAVGNADKSIAFKGDADGLTVNVTIDGNSGETIDDEDSRQFNAGGLFVILSDGTNWHVVAEVGSWVTYTPVWTGLSADPVMSEAKYWRTGKNCIVQWRSGTDGTSNATTKTITFPFNAYSVIQFASVTSVRNNGTTQTGPGYLQTRANSNVVDLFRDAQSLAWTASGGFRASGTVIYQVE